MDPALCFDFPPTVLYQQTSKKNMSWQWAIAPKRSMSFPTAPRSPLLTFPVSGSRFRKSRVSTPFRTEYRGVLFFGTRHTLSLSAIHQLHFIVVTMVMYLIEEPMKSHAVFFAVFATKLELDYRLLLYPFPLSAHLFFSFPFHVNYEIGPAFAWHQDRRHDMTKLTDTSSFDAGGFFNDMPSQTKARARLGSIRDNESKWSLSITHYGESPWKCWHGLRR